MKLTWMFTLRAWAAIAAAAGLAWTAVNFSRAGSAARLLEDKAATVSVLHALRQKQAEIDAAFAALAALSNAPPALEGIAAGAMPGIAVEIREMDGRALERGLAAQRFELKAAGADLSTVPSFLKASETQMPPWRLIECSLAAAPGRDGFGTVRLVMETVAPAR